MTSDKAWLAPFGLILLMVGQFADDGCRMARVASHVPISPGSVDDVLRHWPAAEAETSLGAAMNAVRVAGSDASDETTTQALRLAEDLLCLHLETIQANGRPLSAEESRDYWDGVQAMLGSRHAAARSAVAGLRSFTKELHEAHNAGALSGELIAAARCGYTGVRDVLR